MCNIAAVRTSIRIANSSGHWFEIIGEAAAQLSPDARAQVAGIPWDKIIGMRHRLVHAYFDINRAILWATVQEGLPPLIVELERHLPNENQR